MRSTSFRKSLITLLAGGCLFGDVSCIPNRDQINSTINSGIMNGIQLAITLAIEQALTPQLDLFSTPVPVVVEENPNPDQDPAQ